MRFFTLPYKLCILSLLANILFRISSFLNDLETLRPEFTLAVLGVFQENAEKNRCQAELLVFTVIDF
ncbi:MAG: hypothetical protein C5B52_01175 [Bacteroidetes bacterium]|nr:MAG: hypothetical protein C5B52_01175 [Bacteroidota bacterium]